jgi:cob(I)alamin adenosyltransferase
MEAKMAEYSKDDEIIEPPTDRESIEAGIHQAKNQKGLVIVNTGNGKGKSTAAFGLMTRAWGRNMEVCVIQFIKMGDAQFGEQRAAKKMGIDWVATGDGFTWTSTNMDETIALALNGWKIAQERIVSGKYKVVILDEFTYVLRYGWLDTQEVIDWLKAHKPPMLHLVITGRDAPEALIEFADLVTEMREIKHPYKEQQIRAQLGIEY